MTQPKMTDLLALKKEGSQLSPSQIEFWIQGMVSGAIPDYQTTALLMAIRLKGMTFHETLALTQAMAESGERLSFPSFQMVFDKHSTGGVGDKVTLILAPILAEAGLPISMLSGRGLGHTGGTIDKFESLEGVSCRQSPEAMRRMMATFGWANAQASESINPADRMLYALRDVTSTVDSIPLITASIISKKLAGGATHLCLDVKCGRAAFMQTIDEARNLAENLKIIGEMGGLKVSGFITRMEEPLGRAVGNYLELLESVHYLSEWKSTPLMQLVTTLGADMLMASGKASSISEAEGLMKSAVHSGKALDRLVAYLQFTGGKKSAIDQLLRTHFSQMAGRPLLATEEGYLTAVDGLALGDAMIHLGAGRKSREDQIDPKAGMVLEAQIGDIVKAGAPLGWLHGAQAESLDDAFLVKLRSCFKLGNVQKAPEPIILEELPRKP